MRFGSSVAILILHSLVFRVHFALSAVYILQKVSRLIIAHLAQESPDLTTHTLKIKQESVVSEQ
jgi:ABC-type molybdenum transport system ATPase subunit/photorepair protein PhrA